MPVRPKIHFPFIACIALLLLTSEAHASCSDAKVRRLANQGQTIASIAKMCDMDEDDVADALDAVGGGGGAGGQKSTGEPVGQCGCWGPASSTQLVPHPACGSGFARPQACQQMCPSGGYAWRGVCS